MKVPRVHENPQKPDALISFNFHDPRVHENPQKSDTLIFFNFHDPGYMENPQKSDALIFFNFHDPGYMKIQKNQMLRFSSTFMTVHENAQKSLDFLQLS